MHADVRRQQAKGDPCRPLRVAKHAPANSHIITSLPSAVPWQESAGAGCELAVHARAAVLVGEVEPLRGAKGRSRTGFCAEGMKPE